MTEPLDFTSVGSKKKGPPAPQRAPKRSPAGTGSPKARAVLVLAAAAVAAIIGFVVFGGGGNDTQEGDAVRLSRFCGLATAFDELAPGSAPGAAPLDTSVGATGRLLQQLGGTVAEMQDDAPAVIRSDVVATVKALQEAAKGNPVAIRSASFQERRQRITSFRQKNCPAGVGAGD